MKEYQLSEDMTQNRSVWHMERKAGPLLHGGIGEKKSIKCILVVLYSIGLYRENAIAIQSETRDPNGGNVCLFSAATCTSQCKLRSDRRAFARNERHFN